ncbi:MAG TPA: hypothetical protein VLD63_05850 [Anaerolineales bacterium]|nr:hypothetical protein [Anaerolineales bacterium]
MRMRDALPGRYLTGDDLDGDVTVVIDRVVLEPFRDPRTRLETRKPVMYFQRAKRGLIVNRTNWRAVADLYGDESDNWTGKRITLTSTMVDAYGKQTRAVRVRPVRPPAPAAPAESAPARESVELADTRLAVEAHS